MGLLPAISHLWQKTKLLFTILKVSQFSILVLMIGAVALVFVPQGKEVILILSDSGRIQNLLFVMAALLWAFQIWYWARIMYYLNVEQISAAPGTSSSFIQGVIDHAPRIMGVLALLTISLANLNLFLEHRDITLLLIGIFFIVLAALFFVFVYFRRTIFKIRKLDRLLSEQSPLEGRMRPFRSLPRNTRRAAAVASLIGAVPLLLFMAAPNTFTFTFGGTATVMLFCIAMWVPIGYWLMYWSFKTQLPILTFLLIIALISSFWNDNHDIRTVEKQAVPASRTSTVENRFRNWFSQYAGQDSIPLVIVAAEGGGIRAAYWTASLLGTIQDEIPQFSSHVFAVSSVSGGSLGGAVFVALSAESQEHPLQGNFRRLATGMLGEDFLSPAIASMLSGDLIQRFLPVPIPALDRSRSLENAWEKAWIAHLSLVVPGSQRFSEPLLGLWQRDHNPAVPSLLLNGTAVENGKRIIASNLVIDNTFNDAYDIYQFLNRDMRLSTAVHGSARFPYVSPAGTISETLHIVDGGYFDNSGATTALEVLSAIRNKFPAAWQRLVPVVLMVANEPQADAGQDLGAPLPYLYETLTPIKTMINVRVAHSSYARSALRAFVSDKSIHPRGIYMYFRPRKTGVTLPLGWALSEVAMAEMDRQIDEQLNSRLPLLKRFFNNPVTP